MQQYTFKNQAYLISQKADVTEVHPFSYWKEHGRRVKKGEKALRVWVPKTGKSAPPKDADTTNEQHQRMYFRACPVFDISQTETQEEYDARKAAEKGATIATAAGVIIAESRHIDIA